MKALVTDEVRSILHDMAEYSKKNMICSFGEEQLMKEYLSMEETEDYRVIVSILYAIIHNDRRQNDDKDEAESLNQFFDEFHLLLKINEIKDSRFRQIVAGACDVVGLDRTVIEYWKEHPEDGGIYFFSDMEKERRLKRKEKIVLAISIICFILYTTVMLINDIRYVYGILLTIFLGILSVIDIRRDTFWSAVMPIPYIIVATMCFKSILE
ncbi:hypothetical protein AALB81_16445 [Lachnospiraceae bacterium 48-33]